MKRGGIGNEGGGPMKRGVERRERERDDRKEGVKKVTLTTHGRCPLKNPIPQNQNFHIKNPRIRNPKQMMTYHTPPCNTAPSCQNIFWLLAIKSKHVA